MGKKGEMLGFSRLDKDTSTCWVHVGDQTIELLPEENQFYILSIGHLSCVHFSKKPLVS